MSFQQYDGFLGSYQVSGDRTRAEMVRRVGSGVQGAVETYFRDEGMPSELAGYACKFDLITHPSDETRIREIRSALPETLKYCVAP